MWRIYILSYYLSYYLPLQYRYLFLLLTHCITVIAHTNRIYLCILRIISCFCFHFLLLSSVPSQSNHISLSFIYKTFFTLNNLTKTICLIFFFHSFELPMIILFYMPFSIYNHKLNNWVLEKILFLFISISGPRYMKIMRIAANIIFLMSFCRLLPSLHRIFIYLAFLTPFFHLLNDLLITQNCTFMA